MDKRIIIAAGMLAALCMTGCSGGEGMSDSGIIPTEASQTTTAAVQTATTVQYTSTTQTASQTSTVTVTTVTKAKTTVPPPATTVDTAVYNNWIEVSNDLLTRPVPEVYTNGTYKVPKALQSIIDEGREVRGALNDVFIDTEENNVYLCMYYGASYGYGGEELSVRKGYSFYRINGDTGEITELANDDDSPLRNKLSMTRIGGKLLVSSYHGFYFIDEENNEIITIDPINEPLAGSAHVSGGKVYLQSIELTDGPSNLVYYREYDPFTNVLRDITKEEAMSHPSENNWNFYEYCYYNAVKHRVTTEEGENGEKIYLIEW